MKGVTYYVKQILFYLVTISTHTPVKGVTAGNVIFTTFDENFNSHAREGRDHANLLTYIDQRISTHTPVKGVTKK